MLLATVGLRTVMVVFLIYVSDRIFLACHQGRLCLLKGSMEKNYL